MSAAPKGFLDTVCDLALLAGGALTLLAGMNMLERIAANTDYLVVRYSELEGARAVRPADPIDAVIPPRKSARPKKSAAPGTVAA